jgi:hypothetical protein
LLILSLLASMFGIATAQERVSLTIPETKPNNTGYTVERFIYDDPSQMMTIQLKGDNGEALSCVYSPSTTPTAKTLWDGLNKANLSTAYAGNATTGSLKQRIFHRLVVMGESAQVCDHAIVGTIAGSVQ